MSILEAFAEYLATTTGSTLGQDLFIGGAPSSKHASNDIWWVNSFGGQVETKLHTGERIKRYTVQVYRRSASGKDVSDKLFDLEALLNTAGPIVLSGFDVIEVEATTFPVDNDLDVEDRKVGLLQASVVVYATPNVIS